MKEQKTGKSRRNVWRSLFQIEEGFKQRQIVRLVALAIFNVTVATIAFIAYQQYELNALYYSPMFDDVAAPSLIRIAIVWVALMAATSGLFTLLTGLFMTHRMAGPVYKFKDELKRIEAGHAPRPIRLRKRDEFQDVAEALTRALETLWSRGGGVAQSGELALDLERIRSTHDEIMAGLEDIDVDLLADADRARVEAWRQQMRALRTKLDA